MGKGRGQRSGVSSQPEFSPRGSSSQPAGRRPQTSSTPVQRNTPSQFTLAHPPQLGASPVGQGLCVCHHLLLVLLELGCVCHLERHSQPRDGVVVGAALQPREHRLVDVRLKLLAVEDQACGRGWGWG